jgi:signal transduction histidine kinase
MLVTNSLLLFSVIVVIAIIVFASVKLDIISITDNELRNNSISFRRFLPIMENQTVGSDESDEFIAFLNGMNDASLTFCVWNGNFERIGGNNGAVDPTDLGKIARIIFSSEVKQTRIIQNERLVFYIHEYTGDGVNVRIATSVAADENGAMRIVQLISNMDAKNAISSELLKTLFIVGFSGMLVSFLIGYLITSRAMKPIEESIRRQKEFVADASHELRTPITVVRTNLDVALASSEESVASQYKWLDNAYRETERMEKLVSDLLLLAKSDLERGELTMSLVDVAEIASGSVERIKDVASVKDIMIERTGSDGIYAMGDRSRLEQLFMIVLDNAVKYSPSSSRVIVDVGSAKGTCQIRIMDQGIGLDADETEKIFERFYRSDKARSRREGGTGLGLSIAKWIVDAHGGVIRASGYKNQGTTITIELPEIVPAG